MGLTRLVGHAIQAIHIINPVGLICPICPSNYIEPG